MQLAGTSSISIVLASFFLVQLVFGHGGPGEFINDSEKIVLQNATIYSVGGEGTFVGSIVIEDGKISAIGPDVDVPADADTYDLTGYYITPGLIESRSKLWLTSAAGNEANTKCELNVVDAIDPWSEDWKELASQGITSVYVQPGSSGLLGGYGAVLRVGPYTTIDEIVLRKEAAVQAAIGINGTSSRDRHNLITQLDKLLTSAKPKEKKGSDKKDEKKGKSDDSSGDKSEDKEDARQDDDESKESEKDEAGEEPKKADTEKKEENLTPATIALRKVLAKEVPLFVEVHHSDALEKILKLADKFDIRIVVDGLSQTRSQVEKLVDSGFPMVVGPLYENGNRRSGKDERFEWLPTINDSPFSLSGFARSARSSRTLRSQAAMAIRGGLDRDAVLSAITSNPARSLGIGDHVGTLEAGKSADIAVFAGDPLDPCSPVRMVISQGKIIFESTADAGKFNTSDAVALPPRLPQRYAIKSTRVLRNGQLTPGTFTVDGTKIASIDEEIEDGVPLFDLGDTIVTPGMVIANSTLGQEASIVDSDDSDTSHLRAVDAVDPAHGNVEQALAGGFIHVGVSPGVANTSAGVVGHVRLTASDYVADPTIASQFVLSSSARRIGRFPSSFNGQLQLVNDLFDGKPLKSSVYLTPLMQRLLAEEKMDNVKAVASGDRRSVIVANSNLEIRSAVGLVKARGIQASLLSSGRIGEFADQLAENRIGIIVPVLNGGEFDAQIDQIITAQQAGVPLAFAGESPDQIRFTAALLVSRGLDSQAALQGLTDGGGQIVGMQNVGIVKDAHADFVVWSGSPLNLASQPLNVIVDGQIVSQK